MRTVLLLAGLVGMAVVPVSGRAAADYDNFSRIGKFEVAVDGRVDAQARLYHSVSPPAFLILTQAFEDAVVLLPGKSQVAAVSAEKVEAREDSAAIASGVSLRNMGEFRVAADQTVSLQFDGHSLELRPKPYLLGLQTAQDLKTYDPLYRRRAEEYQPDPNVMRLLQTFEGKAQVRVYFGSWCPFCQENVPKLMKLQELLGDTGITFDYWGLPRDFNNDPTATDAGIKQVPTFVVTVEGEEKGRIVGRDTQQPEANLQRLLSRPGR
ncbi:MAG TPA: thioredoxin family protein [Acidobacteriota bacterium]|nr:thioredoxin family protein [Acidobacteriota bacterium]